MNVTLNLGPFALWLYTEELDGYCRQHFELDRGPRCLWHFGTSFRPLKERA